MWWNDVLANPDAHHPDHVRLCRELSGLVMNEFSEHARVTPAWYAFAEWVRTEALDQEMYGEALHADPSLLELLWAAYKAGWHVVDSDEEVAA